MYTQIYFSGSIRGGRQLEATYRTIIDTLKQFGVVLSEHVGEEGEEAFIDRGLSDKQIHDRDMRWVEEADLMVAEVTIPSLGVGFEIRRAIELKKPIICLFYTHYGNRLSAMIGGSGDITLIRYKRLNELEGALRQFVTAHAPRHTS